MKISSNVPECLNIFFSRISFALHLILVFYVWKCLFFFLCLILFRLLMLYVSSFVEILVFYVFFFAFEHCRHHLFGCSWSLILATQKWSTSIIFCQCTHIHKKHVIVIHYMFVPRNWTKKKTFFLDFRYHRKIFSFCC